MKSALEATYETTKLVKYFPRRGHLFDETKDDIAPGTTGVRVLCPTRWTVPAGSMLSIIQNYTVLNEPWGKAEQMKAGYAHSVNFHFACIYMYSCVLLYCSD